MRKVHWITQEQFAMYVQMLKNMAWMKIRLQELFFYGGIVISTEGNSFAGDINASEVVDDYEPDELDAVSADLNTYLAVYSVSYHNDSEEMQDPNFPPTFFYVGGDDGIWDRVMGSFNKEQEMGITSELHTFAGVPRIWSRYTC